MIRRLLLVVVLVAIAGCGGDAPRTAAPASASHLPPDADVVLRATLDCDGAQWSALKDIYARWQRDGALTQLAGAPLELPADLDGLLQFYGAVVGVGFEDLRPALGGELLVGVRLEPREIVLQYTAPDDQALADLVSALPSPSPGVSRDGDTLVVVADAGERDPGAVLDERLASDAGPPLPALGGDLVALRAAPAVADAMNLGPLRDGLVAATARLSAGADGFAATGALDYEDVPAEELPLGAAQPVELPVGEPARFGFADVGHVASALTAREPALADVLAPFERGAVGLARAAGGALDVGMRFTSTNPDRLAQSLGEGFPALTAQGESVGGGTTRAVARAAVAADTEPAADDAAFRLEVDVPGLVNASGDALPVQLVDLVGAVLVTASAVDGDVAAEARVTVP